MASLAALGMRLMSVVFLFALTLILARYLGPEQYGAYAFVFALMQVSITIGRGGLMHQMVRDIAVSLGANDTGLARGYLWMGWAVALPASVVMALIFALILVPVLSVNAGVSAGIGLLGAGYIVAMILVGMLEAAIRGSGRVLIGQTAELLLRPFMQLALLLLAALGVLSASFDVSFAIGTALAAAGCALTFALINYFRTTAALSPVPRVPVKPGFGRSLVSLSGTIWIGALNSNINLILLGVMGDATGAGLFQIAAQLTALMTLGLMAANASMAPQISQIMAGNNPKDAPRLQTLACRACELSVAFGFPLALIYVLFGGSLIPQIFGPPFADAYAPTAIMAVGQLLNIAFGSVAIMLYANRQENFVLIAVITATVLNLLLCLLLIPSYSAVGAAIASSVSLILWNTISFVGLLRKKGIWSLPLVTMLQNLRAISR